MDRPDTIIELHRERVEAQAGAVYAGGSYQQPYVGSYAEEGSATLNLSLGRVWFVFDHHLRLWQEEASGSVHDPRRHFAIDLALDDSRVVIASVAGVPLVPLPPTTVTIPNGPRAGEQRQIAYNEIPLFGRLTLHEQLETRQTAPGLQTISLIFTAANAPVLIAAPPADEFVSHLFGPGIERRADGTTRFTGQDPRVTWDLDYAEAYWITKSALGQLLVTKERLLRPQSTEAEAGRAVLDAIAAQIAAAVRAQAATLGTGGTVDLLPNPLEVDPASAEGTRALDAVVQRFDAGGTAHESLVIQLQTVDDLPIGAELPDSVLADFPAERIALGTSGFGILRSVRSTVMRSFCLDENDFTGDPCRLIGPRTVNLGGEERSLDRFEATIAPATATQRGRLIIAGKVSDHTTFYDFDATFSMNYEMDLDDIPREAAPGEVGTSTGETKKQLDDALREAAAAKCRGDMTAKKFEQEAQRVKDRMEELPRTVGVRPTLNPAEPVVNPNFDLTLAGEALAAAALLAIIALPVIAPVAIAGATALGIGGLLIFTILAYVALLIDIDWYGTGMVRGKVQDALGDRPGGSLLPTLGVPVHVELGTHLAVYFRPLPARLGVSCIKRDTTEDADAVLQLVGGLWPTDGKPWKISDSDGALVVAAKKVELYIAPSTPGGAEQPIHVSTSTAGRPYLRSNPDPNGGNNLATLPECPRTP